MANEKAKAPVVVTPDAAAEQKVETVETVAETVTEASAETAVAAPVKTYRCRGLKDHRCRISSETIIIERNKEYQLTEGVCAILNNAGVIMKM